MTVLFLGSGPFGLPALERLAQIAPDRFNLQVGTVPDAPRGRRRQLEPTVIKARATELGLTVHERATLRRDEGRSLIEATEAKLVITADFRLMLPRSFLVAPAMGCFNLHGSLLPRWRGAAPIVHGMLSGDREFGVTLYRMVRDLDAGPIVARTTVEVGERPTAPEAERRISAAAADLVEAWWEPLLDGTVEPEPQDDALATLAPKIEKSAGEIDWTEDAEAIDRRIRALAEWPRTWSHIRLRQKEERVFIDQANPAPTALAEGTHVDGSGGDPAAMPTGDQAPGTIVAIDARGLTIACGASGADRIVAEQVQRAGRKRLSANEFARGADLKVGDRFAREEAEQEPQS